MKLRDDDSDRASWGWTGPERAAPRREPPTPGSRPRGEPPLTAHRSADDLYAAMAAARRANLARLDAQTRPAPPALDPAGRRRGPGAALGWGLLLSLAALAAFRLGRRGPRSE